MANIYTPAYKWEVVSLKRCRNKQTCLDCTGIRLCGAYYVHMAIRS